LLSDPVYGRHTPFWYVPLGVGFVASHLLARFGADVQVDIERDVNRILAALEAGSYDIVAATNYVWNTALSYECLRRARQANPSTLTVQGGPHFEYAETSSTLKYLRDRPALDYYVVGEGERTFAALVEVVLGGRPHDLSAAGLATLREGRLVLGGPPERIKELDEIPSPYLEGLLDRFLEQGFTPILETNRGCPFSCTFCNWGSATVSKIRSFSYDRVCEELTYIARRARGNDHLTIADANFGILSRDRDIALHVENVWRSYGYPGHIHLWYAKNSSHRLIEIAEILGKKVRFLLAVQSLDMDVLANIKRQNIRLSDYQDLANYARSRNLFTASDLIVGLPGDSLESFRRSLRSLYEQGLDKVDMFNLLLIPGTELATSQSRERFGLVTRFRLADGCVVKMEDGEVVVESEEVVIATNTLSQDDYFLLRQFHALTSFWHHCGLGDPITNFARSWGVLESELFFLVLERASSSPPVTAALSYLQKQLQAELYHTHDDLLQAVRRRPTGEYRITRVAFLFARHLIRNDLVPPLVDLVLEALMQLLPDDRATPLEVLGEEVASLRAFTLCFYLVADQGRPGCTRLSHDLPGWVATNYLGDLSQFALSQPEEFLFDRDPRSLPKEDLVALNAATCDADRFNHWYDRIRNARGYVRVVPCSEAGAFTAPEPSSA